MFDGTSLELIYVVMTHWRFDIRKKVFYDDALAVRFMNCALTNCRQLLFSINFSTGKTAFHTIVPNGIWNMGYNIYNIYICLSIK